MTKILDIRTMRYEYSEQEVDRYEAFLTRRDYHKAYLGLGLHKEMVLEKQYIRFMTMVMPDFVNFNTNPIYNMYSNQMMAKLHVDENYICEIAREAYYSQDDEDLTNFNKKLDIHKRFLGGTYGGEGVDVNRKLSYENCDTNFEANENKPLSTL